MPRYTDNHKDYQQDVHDMSASALDYLLGTTHQDVIRADHPEHQVGVSCECGCKFTEDVEGYLGCPVCG